MFRKTIANFIIATKTRVDSSVKKMAKLVIKKDKKRVISEAEGTIEVASNYTEPEVK